MSPTPIDPKTGKLNVDPVSGYPRTLGTDTVDTAFSDSLIFQTVPELYNPRTDRTARRKKSTLETTSTSASSWQKASASRSYRCTSRAAPRTATVPTFV